MEHASIDQTRFTVFFENHGGRKLLLLPGFAGTPEAWISTAQLLETWQTVIGVPLPGHKGGIVLRSTTDFVPSFEETVDQLAGELRKFCRTPVHLAGYSMGGRIALGIVARHPDLVSQATLIGVHPGLRNHSEREARRLHDERWVNLLRHHGVESFIEEWEQQPLFASQHQLPEPLREEQRRQRIQNNQEQLARCIETFGLSRMPDFSDYLGSAKIPITLVAGQLDEKFRRMSFDLKAVNPSLDVRILESCGHNPLLEAPEALASILEEASLT